MLPRLVADPARYRRPVLAIVAVLLGGCLGLGVANRTTGTALGVVLGLLVLVCAVVSAVAACQRKPASFTVDERAGLFRTLPSNGRMWLAITGMLMSAMEVLGFATSSLRHDETALFGRVLRIGGAVLIGTTVVLCVVYVLWVWRGLGLRLGPEALVDRTPLGSLTVPWQALAPGAAPWPLSWGDAVNLTIARPDLVRRRGIVLFRRKIQATDVDPVFLDAAIRYYIFHPEQRPGIGTPHGHEELLRSIGVYPRA